MRRCSVKPYEGNENYIFVSYCHKDKKHAFPIIEQLAYDGYRVWYDEGIDPGSEWPEIIAKHLNGCSACIALVSNNSLNSHNCRREINFALLKKRPFVSVVLEPVVMSLGMEMQLSATQSIFKYTLSSDNEFYSKLYEARFLSSSLGSPDHSIYISQQEDYDNDPMDGLFGSLKRETFSDDWFVNNGPDTDIKHDTNLPASEVIHELSGAWMVRVKTNEIISLRQAETKFGRSETLVDYTITGNSTVGRIHAMIVSSDEKYWIIDNNSKNGTFLNSKKLEPQVNYELTDGDSIRLANEVFSFHHTGDLPNEICL